MIRDLLSAFFVVVILGAGAASILLAARYYRKYRFLYLQTWMYYQILVVAYGLYGLIGSLLIQRVLQSIDSTPQLIITVGQFIPFLGVPFLITGLYLFIKVCLEITNQHPSRIFTYVYFGFHLVFFLVYGVILLKMPQEEIGTYTLFPPLIRISFVILQLIILSIGLTVLFSGMKKVKEIPFKRMVTILGFLFLIIQLTGITLFQFSDRSVYLTVAYLFIYFTGHLPPLLFLGEYLSDNIQDKPDMSNIFGREAFYVRFSITRREREIIQLISQGKTNQEIADQLFITLQTVKDHVHNIYLKLDVRNRVELVTLLGKIGSARLDKAT